jgi:diketogulonate reductase-like aldo/keto reductase
LETLLSTTKSIPTAIQIQCNPYSPNDELVHLCHEKSIHVIASSPFRSASKGWLFNNDVVAKVADKHSVVPENVLLSWHLARGGSVLVEEPILGGSEGHRSLVQLDELDMEVLGTIAE